MPILEIHLATLTETPVAVVRRNVRRPEVSAAVRDGCGRAFSFAREQNFPAGRNVAIYWGGSGGNISVESGVELAEPFEDSKGIVRSATPAGLTASATLIGPYDQLGAAHAAIREWCATNGHRLAGPNWEIYGHWQTEWNTDPSQIRTDIFYQVTENS